MSEPISSGLMDTLRRDAESSSRPKQRSATLDRLIKACDDIASGQALAIVKQGAPELAVYFRRQPVKLLPVRIQDYVEARYAIDVHAKKSSEWTGPRDLTIRKDAGLYDYVRARARECEATAPGKLTKSADRLLDQVEDLPLQAELRFALAHGKQATHDLMRLKDVFRKLRPTIDVEAVIRGVTATGEAACLEAPEPAVSHTSGVSAEVMDQAVRAVMKLQDPLSLSRCGLKFNIENGNVVELRTKAELLTSEELLALRVLAGFRPGR